MGYRDTVATPIVDKNGKNTTVHRRVSDSVSADRTQAVVAPVASQGFSEGIAGGVSDEQLGYFEDSKVSTNGIPIPVYHGASVEFDSFDPARVGKGNDSWGNGFYFTDSESIAKGYSVDSGSSEANVKEFYLNITNPLLVDGTEVMSLVDVRFSRKDAAQLLKRHPDAYLQPNDESGEMSFLGDYSSRYWDKETHSHQEIDAMIDEVAKEYFDDASWVELEGVYGKEHGSAFLNAMHDVTGHDGVIVDFGEVGKHYVAWFPEQMKLTDNVAPTDSVLFGE